MVKRDVKGIAKVTAKGRVYWYAWRERGAPRIHGEYGTADFWASYEAAIRERHVPEPGKFRALVMLYKASAAYQELAPSTKRKWGPWLDRVATYFGTLSIAAFDNPKIHLPAFGVEEVHVGLADPVADDVGAARGTDHGVGDLGIADQHILDIVRQVDDHRFADAERNRMRSEVAGGDRDRLRARVGDQRVGRRRGAMRGSPRRGSHDRDDRRAERSPCGHVKSLRADQRVVCVLTP
jgi:hypothetical protein